MEKFIFYFENLYVKAEPYWFEISLILVALIGFYLLEKREKQILKKKNSCTRGHR